MQGGPSLRRMQLVRRRSRRGAEMIVWELSQPIIERLSTTSPDPCQYLSIYVRMGSCVQRSHVDLPESCVLDDGVMLCTVYTVFFWADRSSHH